jgi:hypothetical protein
MLETPQISNPFFGRFKAFFFFFHEPPSFWDFIPNVSWSVSVHSVVSDRLTARTFCSILMRLPESSGRQSGDLGEKWPL